MAELGMIAAAALAAGALLAPAARGRALAMLGALILTAVLLGLDVRDTPQVQPLLDRPAVAAAVAAGGLAVVAAFAVLFARRPPVFAALAVAAVPFRVPVESGATTADLLLPLHLVIAAGALAWLVPRLREGDARAAADVPRATGPLEQLLAAAVVLYALQAVYASDGSKALERVVFFLVPFLLLFALLRELEWTPRLAGTCLGVLAGLALVFTGVGFWEFSQRTLLLSPEAAAGDGFGESFRIRSVFFDPDLFGRFLALAMLGLAAVLLWRRESRAVAGAAAGVALLWAGLVLTLSRSSLAALLAGLVVLAALRWAPWRTLAAAGAAIAVAAGLALASPGALPLDLTGRLALLRGGAELAAERPVLGHGSGSFSPEYRRREAASSERAAAAARTTPVTVAAEQGIVGLGLYLALLAAALGRLLRGARRSAARAAVAAGFVALVVHTWLHAAFLEDPLTWVLLGAGAALARGAGRGGASPATPPGREEEGARSPAGPTRRPAPPSARTAAG